MEQRSEESLKIAANMKIVEIWQVYTAIKNYLLYLLSTQLNCTEKRWQSFV